MENEEKIVEERWDPDKYRDDLCKASWKRSGAKTTWEHLLFLQEQSRKCPLGDIIRERKRVNQLKEG